MSEKQLIQGCLNGESKTQEELYNLYSGKMLGLCMRYVGDRETARDLLQDGFIRVFTSIHTYSGLGPFEAWMRMIFVNTAIAYLRKKDILCDTISLDYVQEMKDEETAVSRLSAAAIMELVQQLPDGFRSIFNLYAIEGYSHKEIGDLLHIAEGTSRSQYTRAKQWLRKKIEDAYNG